MAQLRATLDVYRESLASDPALDTAVSHALLRSVDAGEQQVGAMEGKGRIFFRRRTS